MAFSVEIFETLNELGFVIQVLVFTYALFWLYITFRDMHLLFGLSSIVAGYLIFIHGISMTLLVAGFVFLVLFGMQIQQLMWFGLFPLLGYHIYNDRLVRTEEIDPLRQQQRVEMITGKMEQGMASAEEQQWLEQHFAQQQMNGASPQAQMDQIQRLRLLGA